MMSHGADKQGGEASPEDDGQHEADNHKEQGGFRPVGFTGWGTAA